MEQPLYTLRTVLWIRLCPVAIAVFATFVAIYMGVAGEGDSFTDRYILVPFAFLSYLTVAVRVVQDVVKFYEDRVVVLESLEFGQSVGLGRFIAPPNRVEGVLHLCSDWLADPKSLAEKN